MKKFYITTAIDYMNGKPHIGHAYEKIATDIINRHFKQRGLETFFLTGSDEHGIKIEKTAQELGKRPKQLCDENSDSFKEEWAKIGVNYDRYIRTTDEDHKEVVQYIFKTLMDKGDIYKASYTGLYCSGCESFLSQRDLTEDGLCPDHQKKPQEVKEENYFFKLSKYKQAIIDRIKNNPNFILPEYRANEVLNQLENTEDISVSRSINSVTWGIPVPGDDSQIIYVWIDALSNYLTGVGYRHNNELFNKFWPADVHIIGKDILKFHSIYWIGILMAMGIELPECIHAHGWITVEETKMSKSLGNVLPPDFIMQEFDLEIPDAERYFLMSAAPYGKDINYSTDDFKNKVNADLANNLGNLLNRSLSMLVKYFNGEITQDAVTDKNCELASLCDETQKKVLESFDDYKISEAIESVVSLVNATNKYVNDTAPWSLAKEETTLIECAKVLYTVLETMRFVSILLYPVIPNISQNIWSQLSLEGNISEQTWESLKWNGLKAGKIASKETVNPVFLRLDSELAGDKKKK
ncbi:MAG: methionine--tRNA ligase [Candidatus Gastranaerophilales bacterium]|nr:methionine--tRNA ligase [Candidatus Gastranaerophilales bacterium]